MCLLLKKYLLTSLLKILFHTLGLECKQENEMRNNFTAKILFTIILLLTYSLPLRATIHYVSHNGNNVPPYLSWSDAADSIQSAINVCAPGDTVIVANGIYYENLVIDSMLTLIGSSMDSTVIDGRGLGDNTIIFNTNGSIENFNIYGKAKNVGVTIYFFGSNFPVIQVRNCQISETAVGIAGHGLIADKIIMKNLHSGINIAGEPNSDNYISNSVIITDNNNSKAITFPGPSLANYYVTNNIILFNGTNNSGSGISAGGPRQAYIYNNFISGFWENIFIDDPAEPVYIINSVLMYSKSISIDLSGDYLFVNNVVLSKNRKGIRGDWMVTSDYNLFWENLLGNLEGVSYGDSDRVADPMFVKDTIPNPQLDFDYHLQAYSPGINSGNPEILDVDGSRSDRGMFGGPYGEEYTYMDLAPKPPANLTAVYDSGLVKLAWNKNTETDFSRYRVYRDTVPNFIYDTTKIIAVAADTFYYDDLPEKYLTGDYYYKITAIDRNWHQSAASEEVHIIVTGVPEGPPVVAEEYKLLSNYPNPFNPSTIIPYRLKEGGDVKITVYNILGELITVLVNGWQQAGYYEVEFRPNETERRRGEEGFPGMETWQHSNYVSGVYLLRMEVIGEGRIPVFSDMRKMMLVK